MSNSHSHHNQCMQVHAPTLQDKQEQQEPPVSHNDLENKVQLIIHNFEKQFISKYTQLITKESRQVYGFPGLQVYPISGNQCQWPKCSQSVDDYAGFCQHHGPEFYSLRVKASNIPSLRVTSSANGASDTSSSSVGVMKGLFAENDIAKDDFISLYHGDIRLIKKNKLAQEVESQDYLLELPLERLGRDNEDIPIWDIYGIFVDAQDKQSCIGRWANDGNICHPPMENNAVFRVFSVKPNQKEDSEEEGKSGDEIDPDDETDVPLVVDPFFIFLAASRDIQKGEEILVDYGSQFW